MNKIRKIFVIISIIIFLFCFSVSVFAASQPSNSFDYLYTFESYKDDNIGSYESTVQNSDEVVSGSYYYFVYYHILNNTYITYSVAKSALSKVELVSDYKTYTDDYYLFKLRLYCSSAWSVDNNHKYILSVEDYPQNFMASGSDYSELRLYAKYNSDNRTFTFPFATNYDTDIVYHCSNDSETVFSTNKKPYIANTTSQLQNLNASMALCIYDIPSSLCYVSLHKTETQEELFNIHLSDFSDYTQRLDESDPFSQIGYVIPWDKVGVSYSIEKNKNYELRLTYTINNNEYHVSKFYNSLVDFTTSGR